MTLNRKVLKRVHSPLKSPKRHNTSLRKKALIRKLSGDVQFGAASKANLKVVVRVRPQNQQEENNARCVVNIVDEHMLVFDPKEESDEFFFRGVRQRTRDLNKRQHKEQKFVFEKVFNEESTNEEVYEATTKDIINTLLSGYNCSVFAYGATGAGKTFTMLGKHDYPGITFLTLMELYRRIEEIKEEKTCEVGISYIEVYNEMVRDLLQPGKSLNIQEIGHQVMIPGLSLHKPTTAEELMQMLARGNQNRSQHPTDANAESSRSHAVFQVFVRQQDRISNVKANVSIAKLSMIDLAGSERGAATGFKGARFREGASINKSLLALGNCINALADGQRHIPYRDSKLTRLLKDSLGGNCQSVMIAAVSSASTSFEDTFNTLRYANRAKTIKTTIKKNIMNVDQHVSNYVKIVEELRQEICSLKEKLSKYEEKEQNEGMGASVTAASESTSHQHKEFEEKIASLEKRLQEKHGQQSVSEVESSDTQEAEVQRKLTEVCLERKALRWELLQLASSQREIEFKVHTCTAHRERMKIIAFASKKLDKSISKCERTICHLQTQLCQTQKLQQNVQLKLEANAAKLQSIHTELNRWGPTSSQPSKVSQELIAKDEANIALRDFHQLSEYLRGLVKEGFSEQNASEQLISLLLTTARQFYVNLRAHNSCTPEMEDLFKNVVDSMDESKIIWADQQGLQDEPEASSQKENTLCSLDASHFTVLPITSSVYISPATSQEPVKTFRKSSMKSSTSFQQLPSASHYSVTPDKDFGSSSKVLPCVLEASEHTPSITQLKNTFPRSPVLSAFSRDKWPKSYGQVSPAVAVRPLSAIMTSLKGSPPVSRVSKETSPVTSAMKERCVPVVNCGNAKEIETFGSVSMMDGCSTRPVSETVGRDDVGGNRLNTTELLQDIQPVECSMNATFAITPAKELNTTTDLPNNPAVLNTTVDIPSGCRISNANYLDPTSSLSLNTTTGVPTDLTANSTFISNPEHHGDADTTFDKSAPLNTTLSVKVPSPGGDSTLHVPNTQKMHNLPCHSVASNPEFTTSNNFELGKASSASHPLDKLNTDDTDRRIADVKTASRKLFQSSTLDSTFNVEETKIRENQENLKNTVFEQSPENAVIALKSPVIGKSQMRHTTLEVPQRPVLLSVENNTERPLPRVQTTLVKDPEGTEMLPPSKECKGSYKKQFATTPQKTPGKGVTASKGSSVKKTVTPGKTQVMGNKPLSTLRRTVSTPSLTPVQINNNKLLKPSPSVKRKFAGWGGALHRTTGYITAKTSGDSNEENVPPGSRKVLSRALSSVVRRDTVSSAAKQSLAVNYKQ